jgi:hypothetical protein
MSHPIPLTVTHKQRRAAETAYCEALGINPSLIYSFLVVQSDDSIQMLAVVSDDYSQERPTGTRGKNHPQGDTGLADELTYMVKIRVVGDES